MCGIAGFAGQGGPSILDEFQKCLYHRGPDEQGTFCDASVGLSNNRLAIIDLKGGRQPIFNEDRSCAIVFNGEIYNYRELRSGLRDHRFASESDTEVILHLYEDIGPAVSERLRGDFAFCIWDSRDRSCLLSRDHIGVKPLFYAHLKNGTLVFSSELAPLLRHPDISSELDLTAVDEYLRCLYISSPRSLIKDVRKLSPGESLLWKDGKIQTWKYWKVPEVKTQIDTPADFQSRTLDRLRTAVRRRLIADVPVGIFLSGGLDSSLIVALASEEMQGLQTFSIGYQEAAFDELEYSKIVSRKFKTRHHEFVISPDAESLIEDVISAMDEPIADSSAIPTYLIARETRKEVKVALSGIGGDELFFGYPRYLGARLSEAVPQFLKWPVEMASRAFSSRPVGRDLGGWIYRFGKGLNLSPAQRYEFWTSFFPAEIRASILSPEFPCYNVIENEASEVFGEGNGSYLDKIFRFDLKRYLPGDLLKLGDTMAMANSLELRVPFCDVDLVSDMAEMPADARWHGYRLKSALREIARRFLPHEIIDRKKQGFMIPIGKWFRGQLKTYMEMQLTAEKLPPFLNAQGVQRLLAEHVRQEKNHTHLLWSILVLTRWLKKNKISSF
jgi:asparagine synthase (glutamine-hydrolysing)